MKTTVMTNEFWDWAKTIRKGQKSIDAVLDEPYDLSFNELSDAAHLNFPDLGVTLTVNRVAERHYSIAPYRWLRKLLRIPPKKSQVDVDMFVETVEVALEAFKAEIQEG